MLQIIAKSLQLSGMATLPFAIYFGESEKSMMYEFNYLLLGSIIFFIGYTIEVKLVK
ncbi:MAG: hypothetical protein U0457_15555 [Candidatus Sericytochromatia bacterium]